MKKSTINLRYGALPAIAAAMALSSTPALSQQAQSASPEAVPTTTPQIPPQQLTPPAASDTTTASPAADDPTSDSQTVVASTPAGSSKGRSTVAANARRKSSRESVRVAARRTSDDAELARPAAKQAAPKLQAPAEQKQIATTSGTPAPTPNLDERRNTAAAAPISRKHDNTVPIAAGSALALIAIGGAAVAINRRRDEDEDETVHDNPELAGTDDRELEAGSPTVIYEEEPAMLAPPVSAFPWRDAAASTKSRDDEPMVETDDREPGETWVQRAHRGPSGLNPSLSLKTRLKRAGFFDKRERDAAAGLAEPVSPTAGLPERLVDESQTETA